MKGSYFKTTKELFHSFTSWGILLGKEYGLYYWICSIAYTIYSTRMEMNSLWCLGYKYFQEQAKHNFLSQIPVSFFYVFQWIH